MNVAFQDEVLSSLRGEGIAAVSATSPSAAVSGFFVRPRVLEITPGNFTGYAGLRTRVRVGVEITTPSPSETQSRPVTGSVLMDRLGWSGTPNTVLGKPEKGSVWQRAWVNAADHFH